MPFFDYTSFRKYSLRYGVAPFFVPRLIKKMIIFISKIKLPISSEPPKRCRKAEITPSVSAPLLHYPKVAPLDSQLVHSPKESADNAAFFKVWLITCRKAHSQLLFFHLPLSKAFNYDFNACLVCKHPSNHLRLAGLDSSWLGGSPQELGILLVQYRSGLCSFLL